MLPETWYNSAPVKRGRPTMAEVVRTDTVKSTDWVLIDFSGEDPRVILKPDGTVKKFPDCDAALEFQLEHDVPPEYRPVRVHDLPGLRHN